jgi:hypothetical protein
MFGVGGGFLTTPLLIFYGIPPAVAVASSATQITGASVSGALAYWERGQVDVKMGGVLVAGGVQWHVRRVEREPQEERRVRVPRRVFVHEALRLGREQCRHGPTLAQPHPVPTPRGVVRVVVAACDRRSP